MAAADRAPVWAARPARENRVHFEQVVAVQVRQRERQRRRSEEARIGIAPHGHRWSSGLRRPHWAHRNSSRT